MGIYPCSIGGMEIFYYHLIRELSKDENIIIITDCPKANYNQNIKIISITNRLFFFRRLGLGKVSLFLTSIIQIYRHRKEIDLIHITTASNVGYYGSIFPLVKKITRIPYVVSFHGGGLFPWSKHSFFYKLFKNANKSIAVSSVIKETLEKRTKVVFDIILPLVPFKTTAESKQELCKHYGIDENAKVLLMVGSFKPIKGSLFVVKSLTELKVEFLKTNNIVLVLAGDGEDRPAIEEIIQKRKYSDFVKLIGNIPNEKIHELFALCDIYIIASEFEGTSKSLLEAMFNELPIIATNVKGINNIIKEDYNGLLFDYNDKQAFTSKLKKAIENKSFCEDLGNQAKVSYEANYSFMKTVQSYKDIFEQVRLKHK